jgi:hypothetical protein
MQDKPIERYHTADIEVCQLLLAKNDQATYNYFSWII